MRSALKLIEVPLGSRYVQKEIDVAFEGNQQGAIGHSRISWCAVTEGRLPSQEGRGEGGW
jgi:hypothetical protein